MALLFVGAAMLSLGAASAAADNSIVLNGDFETPVVSGGFTTYGAGQRLGSWTVGTATIDQVSYWSAASGAQSVDLNGSGPGDQRGSIYQDVPTNPGTPYELSFAMAGNPGDQGIKQLGVLWDGQVIDQPTFDTAGRTESSMGWTTHTYIVKATGSSTRLEFESLAPASVFGPVIDNVTLTSAGPPPDQPLTSLGTLGPSTGVIGSGVSVGWDFSDGDPAAVASDFGASIDWGDKTTATGGVTSTCFGRQCFFLVGGSHFYLSAGTFIAVAHVKDQVGRNDSGGATVDIPATIVVAPAVPPPPADDKKTGGKVVAGLGVAAGGLGVCAAVGVAGVVTAPVAVGCGIGAGVLGISAGIAGWFVVDPPDMNFTHVALPSPLSVRRVQPGRGLTSRAARALNAFATNAGAEIGVDQALMHAVERAQGAAAAGQPSWVHLQLRAAEKYAAQLSGLVKREISLRKALVRALRASRVPNLRVTATAVRRLQKRIARHGLPKTLTAALRASPQEIRALRTVLLKLSPAQASGRLFNQIAGNGTLDALAQWATALTAEASRLRHSKLG